MCNRICVNKLNVGWIASDNEKVTQAAESGDASRPTLQTHA